MAHYTFGDVLRLNGLTRNELKRWTQAGLIRPAVVPGESLRRFSARNLVEAGVCDELRGLGMPEWLLKRVVEVLNRHWDAPHKPLDECSILWIGLVRVSFPPDDEVHETLQIRFVDPTALTALLTASGPPPMDHIAETGVAVPLAAIIADLERRAGDRFDFTPTAVPAAAAAPDRPDVAQVSEALAAKFTNALTAALEPFVDGQPIGDEKVAAIVGAITAALRAEQGHE